MGKIFVTPLMRAVWHEMIAMDKTLLEDGRTPAIPNVATRVAVAIGRHFDNKTAETFVSQPTLAAELGVSEKLIWSAIQALHKRGHLVVKRGGRRSNYYGMPVEKVVAECEIYKRRSEKNPVAEYEIYKRRSEKNPVAEYGIKTEIPYSTPQNPVAEYELSHLPTEDTISKGPGYVTFLQERRKEKERLQGKKNLPQSGGPWQSIKQTLVQSGSVSQPDAAAWLDRLGLHSVKDDVLTLRAPTKFIAQQARERFGSRIQEAWQGLRGGAGGIAAIEFVVAPAAKSLKHSEHHG